eukprot:g25378.t1
MMSMAQKTFLSRLKLTDFRNYSEVSLTLDDRHVVLTGENGAGKTNLLEAVSFLSPGRGLRRSVLAEVARLGAPGGFSIFADVDGMDGAVAIGTGTEGGDGEIAGRRVRINGTTAKSTEELTDHLSVVWLTPAMDGLFTGASSDRRRFLDRLVLSLDYAHGRRASDFERAMRSRNRLLAEGRFDPSWLTAIETQMAGLGIAMAAARQEMLGLLQALAATAAGSPFPTPVLALEGFMDGLMDQPAVDLEESYLKALRDGRGRDAAAGRTLEGPHRSDLLVRHREKDIEAARCSTGEQKALLIGLVLSHARLTSDMTGYAPVLLLDEVAAHLDEGQGRSGRMRSPLTRGAGRCYACAMEHQNTAPLTQEEIERYRRHILLPEVGGSGQQKMKNARVAVIGAGGLGAPILEYLAAAGIGTIGIVDDDQVSLSNLQRQVIHDSGTIGEMKTRSARDKIARLNPHVRVVSFEERFTRRWADDHLGRFDLLVDGSDNFDTRYAAADAAEASRLPLVTGAVGRFDGSITVLKPYEAGSDGMANPRYRDLFPERPPEGLVPACAETGIVGALTGVIGTLMAMEVIKLVTGIGEPLVGRLLLYDSLAARFDIIRYKRPAKAAAG